MNPFHHNVSLFVSWVHAELLNSSCCQSHGWVIETHLDSQVHVLKQSHILCVAGMCDSPGCLFTMWLRASFVDHPSNLK